MGWLARSVYQHLADFHEAVEDLKVSFSGECPRDIEQVLKSIRHIQATMPAEALTYYEEAHSLRAPINSCIGFLQVQLLIDSREGHPLSLYQRQLIEGAIYLGRQFMYDFYQLCYREQFAWFVDVHTDHAPKVSPLFISHLLAWPHMYKQLNGFTVTTPEKPSFPPVLYRPHFIPDLWRRLLFSVRLWGTERALAIMPTAEPQGIALKITKGDLQMTPARWAELINPQWREGYYEPLYELGGSLMPLTWDEGYGQGVIVRLPWAKMDNT
jgi:hypothetical protein